MSNTNSYNKNYNIANKLRQNPRRHVYCFDCKKALRPSITSITAPSFDFVFKKLL